MAIEVVPQIQLRIPRWASILFVVSVVVLIAMAVSFIYFGQASQTLSDKIQEKENALRLTSTERTFEERMLIQELKINQFGSLLADHRKALNIFEFLEQVSHPRVWISEFDFNVSKNTANISGNAQSFIDFGQQLLVFRGNPLIAKIEIDDISLDEDGIAFDLQLVFAREIFDL